jgi:formyltetrahydrofolate synthetase
MQATHSFVTAHKLCNANCRMVCCVTFIDCTHLITIGAPSGHTVHVRDIRASIGAGFLYLLCGDITTIPGLPTRPGFYDVDYDFTTGKIVGLF